MRVLLGLFEGVVSTDKLLFQPFPPALLPRRKRRPLGRFLVEMGVITPGQLVLALHLQQRLELRLGDILIAEGWATPTQVREALAQQMGLAQADLSRDPPDPRLAAALPARFWLRNRLLPWRLVGADLMIATDCPATFEKQRPVLQDALPGRQLHPVLTSRQALQEAIAANLSRDLVEAACTRVPAQQSCRSRRPVPPGALVLAALAIAAVAGLAPTALLAVLCALAFVTLTMFSLLRGTGAVAHLLTHRHLTATKTTATPVPRPAPLPRVSVLVPLFREREIAGALLRRLERLTYPRALLDVHLVLEAHDDTTRAALQATKLPPWIDIVEVPAHGQLTTKPRAINYALDFCRGDLIGVWDAEDAPAPDQIERMVARFATAPPDVACLQGILDFYNPSANWRARCFTLEYASWFRIVLPGIARLGLVVPLGGTTHFLRRDHLERLRGWDAFNVTEDADLGVRLYRAGYRTEMIDTVTYEEANCRAWPWVKQRSRWLKGFLMTYLVHMRRPAALWRDLGPRRFLGVQAFFLGTLGQFLLAPVLWSFWGLALAGWHPLQTALPDGMIRGAMALALGAEALAVTIAMVAVSRRETRFLIPWALTLPLYFPLGVIAAYKALYELLVDPFYWDKTAHGHSPPDQPRAAG